MYYIPVQNVLNDVMAFAYGLSFSYRPAPSQKAPGYSSVPCSSSGIESIDSDSDSSDDDDMKNDGSGDYGSNFQLGRIFVKDSFLNQSMV